MSARIFRQLRMMTLTVLVLAVSAAAAGAAALCGDVNTSESVTSTDALFVLKKSVGQPVQLTCPDHVNRYGFPADTNKNSKFDNDYLLGYPITIEHPATITHFGLIVREGGAHVKMALYDDDNGVPGDLVVGTASTEVVVGSQEIAVAATPVEPGTYWLMGIYDAELFVATDENSPVGTIVRYRALPFAEELPSPFGATFFYDQTQINYWVKVQQ